MQVIDNSGRADPVVGSYLTSDILRVGVLAIATACLVYISRVSLLKPGSHGFYRFFAWEAILALLLLNGPVWFHQPTAWHQLISWTLLLVCIVPLTLGVRSLRRQGHPDQSRRQETELLAFERTTTLVTDGIFRYIRHPLYASLLLLAWGIFFKRPSAAGAVLAVGATLLLILTAKADEAECEHVFGQAYRIYRRGSRMFIPYVF
jgi:protein-S-isoprenylcysteine O-methyltransferase Ste14